MTTLTTAEIRALSVPSGYNIRWRRLRPRVGNLVAIANLTNGRVSVYTGPELTNWRDATPDEVAALKERCHADRS